MTTQLVLQFKTDGDLDSFDKLIIFEEALSSALGLIARVDGHDFGSGEMNIFMITDHPIAAFNLVQQTDEATRPSGDMKAAYRPNDGEDYVPLWPPGLRHFHVV
jgi:hypothetical protein